MAPEPVPLRGRPALTDCLSDVEGLLIATDFDGTLAPITPQPDAPLASTENRRALQRLAEHPATVVAVVSGRSLADLRPRVGIEDIVYVGNHGLEIDRGGPPRVHPGALEHRDLIHETGQAIVDAAADASGVRIENKGLTATIHYRELAPHRVADFLASSRAIVEKTAGSLQMTDGKACLELRPNVDWDKGSALRTLAEDAPAGWKMLYLGDDETDEDAFRALDEEGYGIHVGEDGQTAADYRLAEQSQVAGFLDGLAREIHGQAVWATNGTSKTPPPQPVVEVDARL